MPRGRQGYAVRPGLFIKSYLSLRGEAFIEEIHRAYKDAWAIENSVRKKAEQVKPATYESFRKYFSNIEHLGLVEFVHEELIDLSMAPTGNELLFINPNNTSVVVPSARRYFKLTTEGVAEEDAWFSPAAEVMRRFGHS